MTTKICPVSSSIVDQSIINDAAAILRNGGIVAFPTETVYGLGADALNSVAVQKVFAVKGRPADNPLIVHIAAMEQMDELGSNISQIAYTLAETFMPGPLTLVVKHSHIVPGIVTAGLDTVALRMPNHPVPLALVKELNYGIVGPSANLSGKPSPTTAQHVFDDLNGRIEMILDAGPTHIGVESTVIDTTSDPPLILRPGAITREQIEKVIGPVQYGSSGNELRRSPGTRHRHYAPRARVIILEPANAARLLHLWNEYHGKGKSLRALVYSDAMLSVSTSIMVDRLPSSVEAYSRALFAELRKLDSEGVEIILIEAVREEGLGVAVMDRLRRAADATEQKT